MLYLMIHKCVAIKSLIYTNIFAKWRWIQRKFRYLIISKRKYEEINPPNVKDFCYIINNTYMKEEVVKMEADVLKALKFKLGNSIVKTFLRDLPKLRKRIAKALPCRSNQATKPLI